MRTSAEYFSDLKKMKRNVYVEGEKVERDDPRLQPSLRVLGTTFDLAQNPDYEDLIASVRFSLTTFSCFHARYTTKIRTQQMI